MLLIFLDTETTGLDPEKHRLLDIAFKVIDTESGHLVHAYESLVFQPEAVWAHANPQSLKINGMTFDEGLSGKPEKVIASEIINDLNRMQLGDKSGVFICQNPSFDRPFFTQLIPVDLQDGFRWPYHWLDLASMYWAFRLLNNKIQIKEEKALSKDQIAAFFDLPPESKPHRAMNGVNHLLTCYEAMFVKRKSDVL